MGEEYIRRIMVLGSVPSLGPVVMFDDIEDYLKWDKINGAGDSVLEKSQVKVYNGDYALHVKSRATDPAENDEVYARRELYQRPGKRMRVEMLFLPDAAVGAKYADFEVWIYDGALLHTIAFRYESASSKWQYLNSGGSWADVTGGGQDIQRDSYHRLLFEWDGDSYKYIRLVCDGLEVDMGTVSYYTTADAGAMRFMLKMGLTAGGTPPGEMYYDDVLVLEI